MNASTKAKINSERLWSDLMALGKIGAVEGGGVTRKALSPEDEQARQWLIEQMKTAGLEVRIDPARNVIGVLKAGHPLTDKKAVLGSHLDTVPNGGKFDGALGVLAALECARTIRESCISLPWDLEVISFCDEEAAHNAGTVGSRAMMGLLNEKEIHSTKVRGAKTFARNLEGLGQDPANVFAAKRNPDELAFCLELHIEQGALLESRGCPIGVVTAVVGISRYKVIVTGEAAHAGTTPMSLRKDALVKAAPVFSLLPEWAQARNPQMVATIGQVDVEPGASNVVPGEVRFVVELRSQTREDMQVVRDRLKAYAASREGFKVETIQEKDSTPLAEPLMAQIARAAADNNLDAIRMPSGAGHDAQSLAPYVPTAMIFVPCRGGVSHNPDEWIEKTNAAAGAQVLLGTVLRLAQDGWSVS